MDRQEELWRNLSELQQTLETANRVVSVTLASAGRIRLPRDIVELLLHLQDANDYFHAELRMRQSIVEAVVDEEREFQREVIHI